MKSRQNPGQEDSAICMMPKVEKRIGKKMKIKNINGKFLLVIKSKLKVFNHDLKIEF